MKAALEELVSAQLRAWPEHEGFLRRSLDGRPEPLMRTTQLVAGMIRRMIAPRFDEHAASYRSMCRDMNEEVMHFFRTGRYRHSSFAEVERAVYANPSCMVPYLQGLLLSQVFWTNHLNVIDCYLNAFLPRLPEQARYLEIGPGHGLFCALAAQDARVRSVDAWDISPSSLEATGEGLAKLGLADRVRLGVHDVTRIAEEDVRARFEAVVLSEVLEHLEDPAAVLRGIGQCLAPGGLVFINVPVNSPAIDHIYLLRSPEEAGDLIRGAGFDIADSRCFPATGYTEAQARKRRLTISCVFVASRPTAGKGP